MDRPRLYCGLDLGKVADFSALSVVERSPLAKQVGRRRYAYSLRWLETWELGTPYTTCVSGQSSIVGDVKKRFESKQLAWSPLAIDQTGVGVAVVDAVRSAKVQARITPIVITAGHSVTVDPKTRETHLPKKELISTLLVLLEAGVLKWPGASAKRPPAITRFEKELLAFRETITKSKNVTFGAEQSSHDDLVLSVSLACWLGEHSGTGDPSEIGLPDGNAEMAYQMPKLPEPKEGYGNSAIDAAIDGTFSAVRPTATERRERKYDSQG
jgi:hypothetical protein